MKAKVIRSLQNGVYFVSFVFSEFTQEELAKMKSFGVPTVQVRNGVSGSQTVYNLPINAVNTNMNAGFLDEATAKSYESSVLEQAKAGLENIRQRKDAFSSSDDIEI
jgi:hypothetical protein